MVYLADVCSDEFAIEQFGESRIDGVLSKCGLDSAELIRNLLSTVDVFANGL
jgi:hypothetical protein